MKTKTNATMEHHRLFVNRSTTRWAIAMLWLALVALSSSSVLAQSVPAGGSKNPLAVKFRKLTLSKQSESESGPTTSDFALRIAPNPFSGAFTLSCSGTAAPARLQIIDMRGRVVETREIANASQEIVLGSELPTGTYLVQIIQGEERRTMMIQKVRFW